jgi:hypothetical protein
MKMQICTVSLLALATAACVTPYAPPPTTVSVAGDVTVDEGGLAVIPVTKTGNGAAKFTWQTVPGTADASDFVGSSGTLNTSGNATIAVQTLKDGAVEGAETFSLLIGPKGQTSVADPESVVTIAANGGPPVPPSGDIFVDNLAGLPPINSVDPQLATKPASVPPSSAPDVVGALRFVCGFAGIGRFDPKVYPGDTTGKSHGHQFYGNTHINPASTYESLRGEGPSTCAYGEYPANRSGYWQPWLEDGRGHVLQPDIVVVYYKRRPPTDPVCSNSANPQYQGQCVEMPNGMFYIAGFDFLTNKAPDNFSFTCQLNGGTVYSYKTMAEAAASGRCVAGAEFGSRIDGPSCWDGKRVDSTNHRDHVVYGSYGSWGYYKCPTTHPYVIPTLTILSTWRIVAGDDPTLWRFSSDHMRPDLPAGATFHVDFFMAWEPGVHAMWEAPGCLGKMLNCNSGVTGNGRIINHAANPIYPDPVTGEPVGSWTNPYRVVPIPGVEANTKLVGINYGRSGSDWAGKVGKAKRIPPPRRSAAAWLVEDKPAPGNGSFETPLPPSKGERGR